MSEEAGDVLCVQADGRENIALKWELVFSLIWTKALTISAL
jgi:hypothetical protein